MQSKVRLFRSEIAQNKYPHSPTPPNGTSTAGELSAAKRSYTKRSVAALAVATTILAACGSSSATSSTALSSNSAPTVGSPTSKTLNLAFTADTQPPDPDVFYAGQGLAITTSVYEGLVQYQQVPVNYTGDISFSPSKTRAAIEPDSPTRLTTSPWCSSRSTFTST